jgi:hypothetical protein
MIKSCSVIYFPGTGGNFIKFCLSLSKETVPYYHKPISACSNEEIIQIKSMSANQRKDMVRFKSLEDFKRFHNNRDDFFAPDFYYENSLMDAYFDWSIVSNHTNTYRDRLPYLEKIILLELDYEKYGHWIKNSFDYFKQFDIFGTSCQITDEQYTEEITIKALPITVSLSMTQILQGVDSFVEQYLIVCDALKLTPEIDCSILYYQEWRSLRVDPFI